jgi:hypothetical protein
MAPGGVQDAANRSPDALRRGELQDRFRLRHQTIRAEIHPAWRRAPREIVLHPRHPQRARVRTVTVSGRTSREFDAEKEFVRLPPGGSLEVIATY